MVDYTMVTLTLVNNDQQYLIHVFEIGLSFTFITYIYDYFQSNLSISKMSVKKESIQ